jgi:LmbE family N-acetylglucosaminyl deacetylase
VTDASGRFTVDEDHLGVPERAWAASAGPRLPLLDVPAVARAVVVAPHPDDEVLGAGGLLQRLVASGTAVEVWGVTDGEACFGPLAAADADALAAERVAESVEALARLGLAGGARRRLEEHDGAVREGAVRAALADALDATTLCVAPWSGDGHPDHDAVGRAAAAACRETGASLLQYLVWAWHWADPRGDDLPWAASRRLPLTRRQAATKRWATGAFASQTRRPVDGPDGLPVLPPSVLRRFWRRWEVYVTAGPTPAGEPRMGG